MKSIKTVLLTICAMTILVSTCACNNNRSVYSNAPETTQIEKKYTIESFSDYDYTFLQPYGYHIIHDGDETVLLITKYLDSSYNGSSTSLESVDIGPDKVTVRLKTRYSESDPGEIVFDMVNQYFECIRFNFHLEENQIEIIENYNGEDHVWATQE